MKKWKKTVNSVVLGILIIMLSVVIASATVQTLEDASEYVQIDELQPMAANVCDDDNANYYDKINGKTFSNTATGLTAAGFSYSGSGTAITLSNPFLNIRQSQCGTDLCVFIEDGGGILCWFKVKRW